MAPYYMIKRLFLISMIFFTGCSILTPLQKSKFISISNLIETAKYSEAKDMIDDMTAGDESSKWPRTWYMKGHLCQTAYMDGAKKNDKRLQELYPDQLLLAFESYEKALALDERGRLERDVAPKFVILANEFQKIGESQFRAKKYADALRAFETSLKITKSPFLAIETDYNLVYNTALAAYENKTWSKAITYFEELHKANYSVNATHLLFEATLEKGDTLTAKAFLRDGIKRHNDNEDLVLLLTDLLYNTNDIEGAVSNLDKVIARNPNNYIFPYTKGLIYQKMGHYNEAIDAYSEALRLAPDELAIYVNIATSYYNTGVQIEESTMTLTNNRLVQEQKARSTAAFDSAIQWLDKIHGKPIEDQALAQRVYELYKSLRLSDKAKDIEGYLK
ncbi:MAG: tetratricopeptide repeat protein [Tenuifilaceae bacterium]|jgi:tetratricopeptide (TPR) repeat protein|nr:tetratricopeptide repeat protein [Tenuifilaceae bacterium]